MSLWKRVANDKDVKDSSVRVIRPEGVNTSFTIDPGVSVIYDSRIRPEDSAFYNINCGKTEKSNLQSLDQRFGPMTQGFITRMLKGETQVGFMLSVIHHIRLYAAEFCASEAADPIDLSTSKTESELPIASSPSDAKDVASEGESQKKDMVPAKTKLLPVTFSTGIATFLCVDKKEREHRLAEKMIAAHMEKAAKDGVATAYFFASKPRSYSSIAICPWYRVLNVIKAKDAGYGIFIPEIPGVDDTDETAKNHVAKKFYAVESHFEAKSTKRSEFSLRFNRLVMLEEPTETEWELLSGGPLIWVTLHGKDGPVFMFAYRKYPLRIPFFTSKDVVGPPKYRKVDSVMICYAELLGVFPRDERPVDYIKKIFDTMFHQIRTTGAIAAHGVTMGCMGLDKLPFLGPMLAVKLTPMYLDFYNLCTGRTRNPQDVSLLYI